MKRPSAARRRAAVAHFAAKLAFETDASDLRRELLAGGRGVLVVDARDPRAYARERIPGAISLWHRRIDAAAAAALPQDRLLVAYCHGVGCNASTKAALKLAALGFAVKEMPGGLHWWKKEGYPLERGPAKRRRA